MREKSDKPWENIEPWDGWASVKDMTETEKEADRKRRFAGLMFHGWRADHAASKIFENEEPWRAHDAAVHWPNDPVVLSYLRTSPGWKSDAQALAEIPIPTKEELVRRIYTEAAHVRHTETRLEYYRAVADMMGYMPSKNGVNVSNQIINQPRIQQVPVFASEEEWEKQAKVIEHNIASFGK